MACALCWSSELFGTIQVTLVRSHCHVQGDSPGRRLQNTTYVERDPCHKPMMTFGSDMRVYDSAKQCLSEATKINR